MTITGNWQDWIGRTHTQADVLTPALLARFHATFEGTTAGDLAPQGIHWCICTPEAQTAELGDDGHPRRDLPGSFLPPIALPRRMWASSTVEFHAPLRVGAAVERRSTIAEISEKSGGSGTLVFVQLDHEVRGDGLLAVRERQTLVYREAGAASKKPDADVDAPDRALWPYQRSLTPNTALLFRYSALTFNSHRIHYDAPYARDVEGYAGLVVHGPLMATLLLNFIAQHHGANRLSAFNFRALSPAFVDDALHLVAAPEGDGLTVAALGNDGRKCVTATAQFSSSA